MHLVKHKTLYVISGLVWLAIGAALFKLGAGFLYTSINLTEGTPLLSSIQPLLSVENALVVLVALALVVGVLKGRVVLQKSAKRSCERIRNLPEPVSIFSIYSLGNYLIIAFMMGLGMSMKYISLPLDIRGFIDIAVGAALIEGSRYFFRASSKKALCDSSNLAASEG